MTLSPFDEDLQRQIRKEAEEAEQAEQEVYQLEKKVVELKRENLNLQSDLRVSRALNDERERTIAELMLQQTSLKKEIARLKGEVMDADR
jgi:phage host-nuclease inhibitor protein Gam